MLFSPEVRKGRSIYLFQEPESSVLMGITIKCFWFPLLISGLVKGNCQLQKIINPSFVCPCDAINIVSWLRNHYMLFQAYNCFHNYTSLKFPLFQRGQGGLELFRAVLPLKKVLLYSNHPKPKGCDCYLYHQNESIFI